MEIAQRKANANLGLSPSFDAEFQNNQFVETADELLERALSANSGSAVEAMRMMEGMLARLKADAAKQEDSEDKGDGGEAGESSKDQGNGERSFEGQGQPPSTAGDVSEDAPGRQVGGAAETAGLGRASS